jgi:hypothetical protein
MHVAASSEDGFLAKAGSVNIEVRTLWLLMNLDLSAYCSCIRVLLGLDGWSQLLCASTGVLPRW